VYRRLLGIPIYVFNLASVVFYIFGFIGWSQFQPKFLEFHFRKKASSSGFLSGMAKTISAVAGCLVSGWVASKFKLSARAMAAWCIVCDLIGVVSFFSFAFMSCPRLNVEGVSADAGFSAPACSSDCNCPSAFHAVCGRDGRDYFSPCFAGCSASAGGNYSDCACISGQVERPLLSSSIGSSATDGACSVDCDAIFYVMLLILFFVSFFGSTARMPNSLIMLRAINPKDKSASVGLILGIISLFAFLPAPFVYGFMIDHTCLVWDKGCDGSTRNCLVYDTDLMRYVHNFFPCVLILLATVCDVVVCYLAKDLDLYDQSKADAKIAGSAPNGKEYANGFELQEIDLNEANSKS